MKSNISANRYMTENSKMRAIVILTRVFTSPSRELRDRAPHVHGGDAHRDDQRNHPGLPTHCPSIPVHDTIRYTAAMTSATTTTMPIFLATPLLPSLFLANEESHEI